VCWATIAKSNGVLPGQVEFVIDRVADPWPNPTTGTDRSRVLGATIAKSNGVLPGQVEFVIDRVADQKWSLRCAISVARNFPKWDSGRDDLIFFGPRYTGIMGLQREPVQNLDVKELKYQILDCKTVSC